SFAPAVGPETAVVPLLNGMRHLDALDTRFGADRVLGGSCFISAKLDEGGQIAHISDYHRLAFGERSGGLSPRVEAVAAAMAGARFEAVASEQILLVMWEKWVFLASLAGGLAGSGADWLPRFKPYIDDGKTVVVAPHKVFGPETNDLVLQLRKRKI